MVSGNGKGKMFFLSKKPTTGRLLRTGGFNVQAVGFT